MRSSPFSLVQEGRFIHIPLQNITPTLHPSSLNLLSHAMSTTLSLNVFRGTSEGKIVSDTVTRDLKDHEVFIETTHSGVCGTDEHYLKSGQVMGHEGIGIVRAVGSGVITTKVGARVGFGYTHEICGNCDNCCTGKNFMNLQFIFHHPY